MSLVVKMLPVGQLQSNCYLIYDNQSNSSIVVDPGDEADYIISQINKLNLKVKAIIATHGHFDHILAVNELKLAFNVPFFINKHDEFLLKRMRQNTQHFLSFDPGPPPIPDHYLPTNNPQIQYFDLKVIPTPGHTPGSVSLYSKKSHFVLTGDLIFANGAVGRTDYDYCSPTNLKTSITNILNLPKNTTVYSGHGKETTVSQELQLHS